MNQIKAAFTRLSIQNPDWLRAIENRRTGSHWGGFVAWPRLAAWPWQKLEDSDRVEFMHDPECDYYHVSRGIPVGAQDNIKLLTDFDAADGFDSIVIVEGDHGVELVSLDVKPQPATIAWLIIGPERDSIDPRIRTVWTAYPGRFAVSVKKHPAWNGTRESLHEVAKSRWPIAVKGVNDPVLQEKIKAGFNLSCLTGIHKDRIEQVDL